MIPQITRGMLPLNLEGVFQPWAIGVTHGKILLRGVFGDYEEGDEPKRLLDVLFQDVSRISIADYYDGLHVSVVEDDMRSLEEGRVMESWGDRTMFRLGSVGGCDYIVAGALFWAEVMIDMLDSSPLMEENPIAGSIKHDTIFSL